MSNVQTIKNINPTTNGLLIPGTALPSVAPATPQFKARKTTKITWYQFNNTDGSSRTVTVNIIPAGGSATVATQVMAVTLTAAGTIGAQYATPSNEVLLPGYTIQILASAANVVRASVSGEIMV
jgi:hypothetical protein